MQDLRHRFRNCATTALALTGLLAIAFAPALVPAFGGMDFLNLLYPQAALVQRAFAAGEVPLWNWYTWGGCPLLAAMQSAPLYPPMWLALAAPQPAGLHYYTLLHLVWAGCGLIALVRRYTGTQPGVAVYAGLAYAASGFFLGHIEQANSVAAMSWAPWILLLTLRVAETRRGVLVLAGATSMALLAGHPQHVFLAGLFSEIAMLVWWALERRVTWRGALLVQIGFAVAGLFAAAQLLPTRELQGLSERVWAYPDPYSPALKWQHLAAFVVPRFYNRLAGTSGQPVQYTELGLYAGMITLPLFAIGVIVASRRNRLMLALAITWLLALLFALGQQGFVSLVFVRAISFLQHSRGVARSLNIETALYAMFAAAGLFWVAGKLPLRRAGIAVWAAVLVLVADLAVTHSAELKLLMVRLSSVESQPVTPDDRRLYRFMARDSDFYLDHDPRAIAQRYARVQPNLNILGEIATTDGYEEALLPARAYANFLRRYNRNLRNDTLDAPLLALMGAERVLTEYPLKNPGNGWTMAREYSSGGTAYAIWKNAYETGLFADAGRLGFGGAARAQLTRTYDPGEPLRHLALTSGTSDPLFYHPAGREAVAHEFTSVTAEQFRDAVESAAVEVVERRTNAMALISPDSNARTLLFLQTWFPGWKVVSGAASHEVRAGAPIFGIFEWPAGESQAWLVYSPFSFRLGLFITLVSTMLTLCAVGMRQFRIRQ